MATIQRYVVDLSTEQLDFLEELVNAHGFRVAMDAFLIDETYSALRSARPSLTIIRPDEE
jgi:hypothetical protein